MVVWLLTRWWLPTAVLGTSSLSSGCSHSDIEAAAQAALSSSPLEYPPLISDWEFEAAGVSLNSKSAPGNDGLPADLLLFSLYLIKPFLIAILNACLYQCYFRDCWKIVEITVIGKPNKDDYSTLISFWPISLISKDDARTAALVFYCQQMLAYRSTRL